MCGRVQVSSVPWSAFKVSEILIKIFMTRAEATQHEWKDSLSNSRSLLSVMHNEQLQTLSSSTAPIERSEGRWFSEKHLLTFQSLADNLLKQNSEWKGPIEKYFVALHTPSLFLAFCLNSFDVDKNCLSKLQNEHFNGCMLLSTSCEKLTSTLSGVARSRKELKSVIK